MTKRIVSGIFILAALGALGVILAGALTSGEQLIVRFLTAVIVAALGLYVVSDLRMQAEEERRQTPAKHVPSRPLTAETVSAPPANSTAAFMATVTSQHKIVHDQTSESHEPVSSGRERSPALASAGSETQASTTSVRPLGHSGRTGRWNRPETSPISWPSEDIDIDLDSDASESVEAPTAEVTRVRPFTPSEQDDSHEPLIDLPPLVSHEEENPEADDTKSLADDPLSDLIDLEGTEVVADPETTDTETTLHLVADEHVPPTPPTSNVILEPTVDSELIDAADPPKPITYTTLGSLSYSGSMNAPSEWPPTPVEEPQAEDEVKSAATGWSVKDRGDAADPDLEAHPDLKAEQQPATPTEAKSASEVGGEDSDVDAKTTLEEQATRTGQALQSAAYAEQTPTIDLREVSTVSNEKVASAISAGEMQVVNTLIQQGMLSIEGPITDRDVRTMVYVAFTSNELRKLIQAGGPAEPGAKLDLGPVELFDEERFSPTPRTMYTGRDLSIENPALDASPPSVLPSEHSDSEVVAIESAASETSSADETDIDLRPEPDMPSMPAPKNIYRRVAEPTKATG